MKNRSSCSTRFFLTPFAALLLALMALETGSQGAGVYVPNGSFETPSTPFADPRLDRWQKTPRPQWFVEDPLDPVRQWFNLSGQFLNLPPGDPAHLTNCHGAQAAFLFALPEVGLFQELRQPAEGHSPAYEARFQTGRAYRLSVDVLGGGGGMTNGVALRAALYYLDAGSNRVPVASVTVTNSAGLFTNQNRLLTFSAQTPKVTAHDPWAGQVIGVELLSLADFSNLGGYWDVDNVRVEEVIPVPNGSFEAPATPFVDITVAGWQKTPKPAWFDEGQGFLWAQLTGVYLNPSVTNADHTPNTDGAQALWLFAVPEVGLFLDRHARDMLGQPPAPAFDVTYEVGQAYQLTVGVFGGGGGMTNGASMELVLYYVDQNTNRLPVASTAIVYTNEVFTRWFQDYHVRVPTVKAADPWAGRPLGIGLYSTTSFALQGGFFNVDNVRLATIQEPALKQPRVADGRLEVLLRSEPGERLEVLSSHAIGAPAEQWQSRAVLTNTTGSVMFQGSVDAPQQFLRARRQP